MDHYWLDLPGPVWFSGAEIYRRFVENVTGPAVAVELGAWKGRSACFMGVEIANSGKPVRFYDGRPHWQGSVGEEVYDSDPDVRSGRLYAVFLENIQPVADHVNVIRGDSAAAAAAFEDESVDFLYIDESHRYEQVLRDLMAWYPKVKPGGLIAGDERCFPDRGELGVRTAVWNFFRPSLSHLSIEPGSARNENWSQWSIVKAAGMAVASPVQPKRAAFRRKAVRLLAARTLRHRLRRLRGGLADSSVQPDRGTARA